MPGLKFFAPGQSAKTDDKDDAFLDIVPADSIDDSIDSSIEEFKVENVDEEGTIHNLPPIDTEKALSPLHHHIIELHLAGYKNIEIAPALSITPQTVSNVLNSDAGKAIIQSVLDSEETRLMSLKPLVVDAVKDSLDPERASIDQRLKGAKVWNDLTSGKQTNKTAEDVIQEILKATGNINMQFNVNIDKSDK